MLCVAAGQRRISPGRVVSLAWFIFALSADAAPHVRPPKKPAVFDAVVVAGIGSTRIEGQTALSTRRQSFREWTVQTLRSQSVWDDAGGAVTWDSDQPSAGAPWPLVTQHAVASVPAQVVFDRDGSPVRLAEPDQWTAEATAALRALDLPEAGVRSGEPLVDPAGLVFDLSRTFVGTPSASWTRRDRLSGVLVDRQETCDVARDRRITTWTCRGTATEVTNADGQLQNTETWTTVTVDRTGLLTLEEGWSGTLVHLARDGVTVTDSPIGGRRLVQRQ